MKRSLAIGMALACALLCANGAMAQGEIVVLEDYENDLVGQWNGGRVVAMARDTADVPTGGGTASMVYTIDSDAPEGWGSAQHKFTGGTAGAMGPTDISGYTHIKYWAKSTNGAGGEVRLVGRNEAGDTKVTLNRGPHINYTTEWTEYEFALADARQATWGNYNGAPIDWTRIEEVEFSANDITGVIYIDNVIAWRVSTQGPPVITSVTPDGADASAPDAASAITVNFNKPVTGVTAGDLTVDGSPATTVTGSDQSYTFSGYTLPTVAHAGTDVAVALAAGSITAGADAFAGDAWTMAMYDPHDAEAPYTATAPAIDGVVEAGVYTGTWYDTWEDQPNPGNVTDDADLSLRWTAAHDKDSIYLIVDVKDAGARQVEANAGQPWTADNVEITIDYNLDRATSTKYRVDYSTGAWATSGPSPAAFSVEDDGTTGYVIEVQFTKADIPADGIIGFNLQSGDNDGAGRETNYFWNVSPTQNNPHNKPQAFGNLALLPNDSTETGQGGAIMANVYPPFIDAGTTVILTAPAGGTGHQWKKDGIDVPGANGPTLPFPEILEGDAGVYTVEYDDGTKALVVSEPFVLNVGPEGTVPVSSLIGLLALAGACGLGGSRLLRRKR